MANLWNRVREERARRGWSQRELAERTGLSRSAVSAVETGQVEPSTAAALALAGAFGVAVEDLFGVGESGAESWAWPGRGADGRYWRAETGGRVLRYPVEWTALGAVVDDGGARASGRQRPDPRRTLVIAGCDPSVGLLRAPLARRGIRLLAYQRSSGAALALLRAGLVHAAGVHLSEDTGGNAARVSAELGAGYGLVHVAQWWEGVAVRRGEERTIGKAGRKRLRWVGREVGSGARRCQDEVLSGWSAARVECEVGSHGAVVEVIRAGYADAGVCVRVVAEEAGLSFVPVRGESYDLFFAAGAALDPRLEALFDVIRTAAFRRAVAAVPGYEADATGEMA